MAKLAILGYGRMGQLIAQRATLRGHNVAYTLDRNAYLNEAALANCDVAIEFSVAESAAHLCEASLKLGVPVISGSTGWDVEAFKNQQSTLIAKAAFLHATNMSIGVNAMFAATEMLSRVLAKAEQIKVGIRETHHMHKLDAPSGTAITLAERVIQSRLPFSAWHLSEAKALSDVQIPIVSLREGEVFGDHEVNFVSENDVISLTHSAKSRAGFADGALLAAEFMIGKKGAYTMQDVLGLTELP